MLRTVTSTLRAAAVVVALVVPAAFAQDAAPFYEPLIRKPIIPDRNAGEIEADLDAARTKAQQSDQPISEAQARLKEADGWLSQIKGEIDRVNGNIDLAKREKRNADKMALDAQKKQLEMVQDYFKKVRSSRDAQLDVARNQKDASNAQVKALEAEAAAKKRLDTFRSLGPDDPNLTNVFLDAMKSGENALQRWRDWAQKNLDVAELTRRVADRWLDAESARGKLFSEARIKGSLAVVNR
mgnify:CR=1 FL=1